jgi:hypothetical protein
MRNAQPEGYRGNRPQHPDKIEDHLHLQFRFYTRHICLK